jgi:hypothetical protein
MRLLGPRDKCSGAIRATNSRTWAVCIRCKRLDPSAPQCVGAPYISAQNGQRVADCREFLSMGGGHNAQSECTLPIATPLACGGVVANSIRSVGAFASEWGSL